MHQVSFADNSNDLAARIDHWNCANVVGEQDVCHVSNSAVVANCYNRRNHDIARFHAGPPGTKLD